MKVFKEVVFYILSLTWGIILTLVGLIAGLFLTITGHLPTIYHHRLCWKVGENWGGASIGCIMICDKNVPTRTLNHECGHMLQNAIIGPLMVFLVSLPSAFRYQVRNRKDQKSRKIFAIIITIIGTLLGLVLSLISAFVLKGIAPGALIISMDVIGTVVMTYSLILGIWMLAVEIPRYKDALTPYDSVWFERTATEWGTKYVEAIK